MRDYQVKINSSSYGGDGVGRLDDGRTVFVPYVIPGEEVRIRLIEEKRSFARAELVEVLTPALSRVTPRCRHFGVCGGCHYQHMDYESQLRTKRSIFLDTLRRVGNISEVEVPEVIPSPQVWNYRNHIQFHPRQDGTLGFQASRSHQVIPIVECHLAAPALLDAWHQFQMEESQSIQRVSFRCGVDEDIQIMLESDSIDLPELELDTPDSVIHISPAGMLVLAGSPHTMMEVNNRLFKVSAGSFFQVNTGAALGMVDTLVNWLMAKVEDRTLLDLYCGVGLFSAFLVPKARKLIGVEISEPACDDFAFNLDEFDQIELYQGQANEILRALPQHPEIVVVDPPRAGLEAGVIADLDRLKPTDLVYVSCDPTTLARDLRKLLDCGYSIQNVQLVDMFPQTFHIESLTHLVLKPL